MTTDKKPMSIISEDDVADYLRQHLDFFVDKPSLLADLELPHQTGSAVSLVERQVSVLRERNMDSRHRLSQLLENARNNDKLFEKTKRLILSLLEAQDINDVIDAILYSFSNDFNIEHTSLLLFSDSFNEKKISANDNVHVVSLMTARQIMGTIISNNRTVCGQLEHVEQEFIFNKNATAIGSTAITPLCAATPLGVLAIGNADADYYRSSMSTLFLTYIGEVLSRILPQHITP